MGLGVGVGVDVDVGVGALVYVCRPVYVVDSRIGVGCVFIFLFF